MSETNVTEVGKKLGALIVAFVLCMLSVPWIVWAVACVSAGDERGYDLALGRSPLDRWLNWVEAR